MNNFKRVFVIIFLALFCTGCTSTQTNFKEKDNAEEIEREYKITSTNEFKMADIKFKIPDYFEELDSSDDDYKFFNADNSEIPILCFAENDGDLTDDYINKFVNGYLDNDDLSGFLDGDISLGKNTRSTGVSYYYAYSSGTFILDNDSKADGDIYFYFLSNNSKSKFVIIIYNHFDNFKYDYENVVNEIIENAEITDKKEEEEGVETETTDSNAAEDTTVGDKESTTTQSSSSNTPASNTTKSLPEQFTLTGTVIDKISGSTVYVQVDSASDGLPTGVVYTLNFGSVIKGFSASDYEVEEPEIGNNITVFGEWEKGRDFGKMDANYRSIIPMDITINY